MSNISFAASQANRLTSAMVARAVEVAEGLAAIEDSMVEVTVEQSFGWGDCMTAIVRLETTGTYRTIVELGMKQIRNRWNLEVNKTHYLVVRGRPMFADAVREFNQEL